jgi:phage terminase small subunit
MKSSRSSDNGKSLRTGVKRGSTSHELPGRQKLFALEYLKDLNATQAAIRAGYSPRTAEAASSRLLRNVKVAAQIQKAMNARAKRIEVNQDTVLQGIARLAFWDLANMFDADGSLKDIRDMDVNTREAIAGFECVTVYEGNGDQKHAVSRLNKVKLVDKGENLERLGRHLKLFTDVVQHEFSSELTRIIGGGIDLPRFSDKELAEFNSSIAALFTGSGDQRSLPPQSAVLAPEPHENQR